MFSLEPQFLHRCWEVLLLFLIPFGGGIPVGVIQAQKLALAWPVMMVLYFISDIVLACVFEPLMYLVARYSRNNPKMERLKLVYAQVMQMLFKQLGIRPTPLSLVFFTFGTDPMTGRVAAYLSGHLFFTGWAIAIAGDMIFFSVVMVSTLWLNSILGNGTVTAVIITLLMLFLPSLIKKLRK